MVHYIRFLRVPRVQLEENGAVKFISAVLTVTTDLGEIFFPDDLELVVRLVNYEHPNQAVNSWIVYWQKNSRVVKLQLRHRSRASPEKVRLHVASRTVHNLLAKNKYQTPEILDVWSAAFNVDFNSSAEDLVERELHLTDETCVKIWEETGDSIARHIWDGALGCLDLYKNLLRPGDAGVMMPYLHELLIGQKRKQINVVELGSGCGVAGIALAQIIPGSRVLLTDLEEAQHIITKNINSASLPERSSLKQEVLDWNQPLPADNLHMGQDLLVVCECIYNADSDPALVNIIQQFIKQSPSIKILVIVKRRHYSETIFFELMQKAGIRLLELCLLPLPHHVSDEEPETPETSIYLYGASCGSSGGSRERSSKVVSDCFGSLEGFSQNVEKTRLDNDQNSARPKKRCRIGS